MADQPNHPSQHQLTRRSFLALSAAAPFALRASLRDGLAALPAVTRPPLGIELYSVREALKKDPEGTVRAVAQLGYKGVEFYSPYFEWTEEQTKSMRRLLDDLGIWCKSTHNDASYLSKENLAKARDRNAMLGAKYVVVASAKPAATGSNGPGDWSSVADLLNAAADGLAPSGLKTGYHNHEVEFTVVDGKRPIETIAAKTTRAVMLQLDIGTCIQAGSDPVAWIKKNPGRIHSLHLKDFSPEGDKGFKVLFGEGIAKWKEIFAAAESTGGAQYYLMEQEGSRLSEIDTAKACLEAYNKLRS